MVVARILVALQAHMWSRLVLAFVFWMPKRQPIVTLSTTEAECVAACKAGKEIVWMHKLLQEIGFELNGPSTLHMDNQSAIQVAKHPEHHGRMKHLDLHWYWL